MGQSRFAGQLGPGRRAGRQGHRAAFAAAALLACAGGPAQAQDERPTGYPRSANERTGRPVELSAVYTVDLRGNVAGGIARGMRYLDNLDLQAAIDADRLIGWSGARAFVYVIRDNGAGLSRTLVGDVQGVSNIETKVAATRLFEAWLEQDIGRRGSLKAGLYNLNSEFDTTDSGGLFLLSSHGIGPDLSQSGRNGPSIFPITALALRGEYELARNWLVRAAVLDGVPGDPAHPKGTAIKLSRGDGALLIAELDYLAGGTKAAIGAWRYTTRFAPLEAGASRARGNGGLYVFAEHRLRGTRKDDAAGLAGWLRFGVADGRFNPLNSYVGGGLVQTGTARARGNDQVGVSLAVASFGALYRRAQTAAGMPANRREIVIESVYNAILTPWLSLSPDVQYVINPGGVAGRHDAVVVGFRLKLGQ